MSDTSQEQFNDLILRNLDQLDIAAHQLIHEIEPAIGAAIDRIVRAWAKANEWDGEFGWSTDAGEIWLAPKNWNSDDGWLGEFHFEGEPDDTFDYEREEDVFWLTRLCQKGRGCLGFRWYWGDGLGATSSKWKKFVREKPDLVRAASKQGFIAEESGFLFLRVSVEANALASAMLTGKPEEALRPLQTALGQLAAAQPQFDAIVKAAQKYFA